jgi:hypothetical protein
MIMRFLIIIYFQGALVFHEVEYNVVDNNGGWGGLNVHLMTIFLKLFNIVDENELKKIKIISVPLAYFPYCHNFIIHNY